MKKAVFILISLFSFYCYGGGNGGGTISAVSFSAQPLLDGNDLRFNYVDSDGFYHFTLDDGNYEMDFELNQEEIMKFLIPAMSVNVEADANRRSI